MPEGFPTSEIAPVSLFEQYADVEVTIKGVTGMLKNLVALCPVDEKDMDPLKKEQWTADMLIDAGYEISTDQLAEPVAEYVNAKKK